MLVDLKAQYIRELDNWLTTTIWTLKAVKEDPKATNKQRLDAVEVVAKQLPEVKRRLIFLLNTEKGT